MVNKNIQSLGGKATAIIFRKRAIDNYYSNPNKCKYCSETIHPKDKQKISEVRKKSFCNHYCSASYFGAINKKEKNNIDKNVRIKKTNTDEFNYKIQSKSIKSNRILNGYLAVYMPEHPKSMKSENWDGYIYEHIPVAEKDIGRYLRDDEEVHHLDFNKMNNSPDNLLVMIYQSHGKLHQWLKQNNVKPLQKELIRCLTCGYPLSKSKQDKYCSDKCYVKSIKSNLKITLEQLISDFKELKSFVKVGNKYNLSDNGLRKWMSKEFDMTNKELNNFKLKYVI